MASKIDIYNKDCIQGMGDFDDDHFDVAIVDPPYGIGQVWSKSRKDRFHRDGKLHSYKNDKAPCAYYFKELMRVSKYQIIWGGNYFTKYLPPTNSWIVWTKNRDADKTFMSEGELAWTSFHKCLRVKEFIWDGSRKCEKTNKIHPHQKPVQLYKWILKTYCNIGFCNVLDTHVGSGSLAIACYDMGYDMTGFEIDKHYYKEACNRIDQHKKQLTFI